MWWKCSFFSPLKCVVFSQRDMKKKKHTKNWSSFFPPLSNLAAEECRGCALNRACRTNNHILQFPLWVLLFSVLNLTHPPSLPPLLRSSELAFSLMTEEHTHTHTNTHATSRLLLLPHQLLSHRPQFSYASHAFTPWNCRGNRLRSAASPLHAERLHLG